MSYEIRHVQKIRRHRLFHKESSHLKKILDRLAYPVAVLVPLSSLDQVLSIWQAKSAAGVSVVVWVMLFLTSIFWICYGIVHKERVIFFGHTIWIILSSIVLAEIIYFL